ncbi:hypothetical protein IU433_23350 [Nocardia puris]|uniref:Uncharacterized protein n=1 Tax=Nocardia puris TaxID=208602 RepID=A0A366DFX7_9NOCA|nr:hypothetical protein [Nocardia puris]MBF6212043.1 hypothetical protein [Nocardia puris]MBF6367069.1 hypothetical protein [Nocardia puris]MBF6461954.1 hypothetical protein [Nocardia puris]RBO88409.1 hypothetical protein DFR74_109177 [Nocardia puris]
MSYQYQPPPDWTPPGAQFRSGGTLGRTAIGVLIGLVVTPIGLALAAHGAATTRQWVIMGDAANRWGSTFQIIAGAALLLLVAALAAYSPAGTILAGMVWGIFPGIVYFLFPDDTFRLIDDLPLLSDETRLAVHAWVINGSVFLAGVLLVGAGVAATLRRR